MTRLITTRLNRVVPADAFRQPVDAMKGDEARELAVEQSAERAGPRRVRELDNLAARLGEWAQLLKLVNGFLRERVIEGDERAAGGPRRRQRAPDEERLGAFDADDEGDRTKTVARTINLSLGLLDEKQRARFAELAVFPEDADIPIGIVARHVARDRRIERKADKGSLDQALWPLPAPRPRSQPAQVSVS